MTSDMTRRFDVGAVLFVIALAIPAACDKGVPTVPTATALSPEGSQHTHLSWSPDGKRIAWWAPGPDTLPGSQLWVANADFTSPATLPVVGFPVPVAWSRDGKQVVASRGALGQVVVVPAEPLAGTVAQRVTPGTAIQNHVMLHPDGDRILYIEFAEGGAYTMSVASRATGKRTPLVPTEKHPYIGIWSPDASHIAYAVQDGSKSTIWVADSGGLNPRQLTTEGFETPGYPLNASVWSPDGKEILYESRRTGTADLWIIPIDGSKARQLTRDVRNDYNGEWSGDGKWIAFQSDRGRQKDVWVVSSAGGTEYRITDDAAEQNEMPRWRPGTHELTFTSTTYRSGLWALALDGGRERQLTPDSIRVGEKTVSPDGMQVAFVIERGGGIQDVAVMPVAGGAWRTVVAGSGSASELRWSPDASRIAFSSDRGGTSDIWVVSAAGGAPRQVESWPGFEHAPTWSEDGAQLYFASDRDSKFGDVWKAPAGGGEPVRVTHANNVNYIWSRAGVPGVFLLTVSQHAGDLNIAMVTPDGSIRTIWDQSNALPGPISPKGDSLIISVLSPTGKLQATVLAVGGGTGQPILSPLDAPQFWSKDGAFVLYTFSINGRPEIGLLNRADSKTRRLTTSPEDERSPELTADGKTVVFRRENNLTRIYTTDLTSLLAGAK